MQLKTIYIVGRFNDLFDCTFRTKISHISHYDMKSPLFPAHKTISKITIECELWQCQNVTMLTPLYIPVSWYLSWWCRWTQEMYGTSFIWAGKMNIRIHFVTRGSSVIPLRQLQFPISYRIQSTKITGVPSLSNDAILHSNTVQRQAFIWTSCLNLTHPDRMINTRASKLGHHSITYLFGTKPLSMLMLAIMG